MVAAREDESLNADFCCGEDAEFQRFHTKRGRGEWRGIALGGCDEWRRI